VRLYSRPGPKDGGRDVFVHICAVERAGARFLRRQALSISIDNPQISPISGTNR
jgi:hypothetical protein